MNERIARKLDFTRKLLLTSAGLLAISLPVIFGLVKPAQSRAESAAQTSSITGGYIDVSVTAGQPETDGVVSTRFLITPDQLSIKNMNLATLIREAFELGSNEQVSGIPAELFHSTVNIQAKVDPTTVAELKKSGPESKHLRAKMFQDLLADQLKLVVHHDMKPLPVLALVISSNGPKIQPAKPGDTYPSGIKGPDGETPAGAHKMNMGPGQLIMQALPLSVMADLLSRHMDSPVVDKTNLTGDYDVSLHWTTPKETHDSDLMQVHVAKGDARKVAMSIGPENSAAMKAAIEDQLGLRLEPQTVPLDSIIIDRVQIPQGK